MNIDHFVDNIKCPKCNRNIDVAQNIDRAWSCPNECSTFDIEDDIYSYDLYVSDIIRIAVHLYPKDSYHDPYVQIYNPAPNETEDLMMEFDQIPDWILGDRNALEQRVETLFTFL